MAVKMVFIPLAFILPMTPEEQKALLDRALNELNDLLTSGWEDIGGSVAVTAKEGTFKVHTLYRYGEKQS